LKKEKRWKRVQKGGDGRDRNSGSEITSFLQETYHIFRRKDKLRIKVTYWYEMYSDYKGELVPETSEGIKKAKWKNLEKSQKALPNLIPILNFYFQRIFSG
jgi:hypothetical protein